MKGNKGEWSEIYTFFKLLADGKLYAADEKLNRIPEQFYPIIKILREEFNNKREYVYRVKIKRKGNCEMGFNKNKWVLIQKIPKDISVKFNLIHLTK